MKSSQQQFKDGLDKAYGSLGMVSGDIDVMMNAQNVKGSMTETEDIGLKYFKPNFEREFDEAKRYRELKRLSKDEWKEFAKTGKAVSFNKIKDKLGNVDFDFEKLDRDKKLRFQAAFKNKKIEAPIVLKFNEGDYDLLGGNTRLAGLVKKGINPLLWVLDMDTLKQKKEETKESEKLKGGKADEKNLLDLAMDKAFAGKVLTTGKKIESKLKFLKRQLKKGIEVEKEHTDDIQKAKEIALDHLFEDPEYYVKLKKVETKEVTGASSAGSFVAPFSFDSKFMKKSNSETPSKSDLTEIMYQDYKVEELSKATNSFGQTLRVGDNAMVFDRMKPIKILALVKKPNGQTMALHKDRGQFVSEVNIDGLLSLGKEVSKIEAKEITGAASSGQYSGPAMWAKSTNKKDWRGASKPLYKGGKFVQVKGKCKKFPYCNQGDINALKIWENVNLNTAIKSVSSKSGLGENVIKNLISKEIELKSPKKK